MSRNPTWVRDELILVLDLYLAEGQLDVSHPKVIELSNLLNALPIHTDRPDNEKFRNPNGVACKLANFRAIDPRDPAKGYERGGIGDKVVWQDYFENGEILKVVAEKIRESRLFL